MYIVFVKVREGLCLEMNWIGGINRNGSYYDKHKPCDDDPASVSIYTHPHFISLYRLRHAWEWAMAKRYMPIDLGIRVNSDWLEIEFVSASIYQIC